MKISVLIPTYNRSSSLVDTLESLLQQANLDVLDYEIIVVDNNSNDDTRNVVLSFAKKFKGKLFYLFEPKQGRPNALNSGISITKGDVVVSTDDDVILEKNWLMEIHNIFSQQPTLQILCGKVLPCLRGAIVPDWCDERKFYAVFGCTHYGEVGRYLEGSDPTPGGMNTFVRKNIFASIGGFNPDFLRGQDTEFCRRAKAKNIKMFYEPKIITYHKVPVERLTKEYFRRYFFISGKNNARSILLKSPQYINSKRKLGGVPLWMLRESVFCFLKSLYFSMRRKKKRCFSFELEWIYVFGLINGIIRRENGKS